jgi:hypothetical protein
MAQLEQISYPPKSAFGFFSPMPFWGANCRFRKQIRRQLLSRSSSEKEIGALWADSSFSAQEIQDVLKCIRVNHGWPNALFLPSDSFLALAPLAGYDSFTADTDTVNDMFFVLNPDEKEKLKSAKGAGGMLEKSLVFGGDIPILDVTRITPEMTVAEVMRMMKDWKNDPDMLFFFDRTEQTST